MKESMKALQHPAGSTMQDATGCTNDTALNSVSQHVRRQRVSPTYRVIRPKLRQLTARSSFLESSSQTPKAPFTNKQQRRALRLGPVRLLATWSSWLHVGGAKCMRRTAPCPVAILVTRPLQSRKAPCYMPRQVRTEDDWEPHLGRVCLILVPHIMTRVKWVFHSDAVVDDGARYDTVRCSWEAGDGIITVNLIQWLSSVHKCMLSACVMLDGQVAALIHHCQQLTACPACRIKSGHQNMIRAGSMTPSSAAQHRPGRAGRCRAGQQNMQSCSTHVVVSHLLMLPSASPSSTKWPHAAMVVLCTSPPLSIPQLGRLGLQSDTCHCTTAAQTAACSH